MKEFIDSIPAFDAYTVFVQPWTEGRSFFFWIALMGFLVTVTCGLIGNYLILRRMALVGDAISHSVLPGLAVAYIISRQLNTWAMFAGAIGAGILTTLLIEFIHSKSRTKTDSAIGITFCTLFAIGVLLITLFASKVHLDTSCVLYGVINHVPYDPERVLLGGLDLGPRPVVVMALVCLLVTSLIILFYKELLVSSFDPALAAALGFRPRLIHYALMGTLSVVVVSAFESVGAILVIAMLILPGATAQLISSRLGRVLLLSVAHAFLSALGGMHLGLWLDCSIAAAIVVAGGALFVLAWLFAPYQGVLWNLRRRESKADPDFSAAGVASR